MLKVGFKDLLAQANAVVETVSVSDLQYHLEDNGALLVDVREFRECEKDGVIPSSIHASRGLLEFHADPNSELHIPDLTPSRPIILYCGSGGRSVLAAKTLKEMGFPEVYSLAGGYAAWRLSRQNDPDYKKNR